MAKEDFSVLLMVRTSTIYIVEKFYKYLFWKSPVDLKNLAKLIMKLVKLIE